MSSLKRKRDAWRDRCPASVTFHDLTIVIVSAVCAFAARAAVSLSALRSHMSPCRSAASQHTTAQATRATLDASRRSEHRGNRYPYRRCVLHPKSASVRVVQIAVRACSPRIRIQDTTSLSLVFTVHTASSASAAAGAVDPHTSKRLHMDMLTLTPTSPAPRPSTVALLPALPSPRRAAGAVAPIRLSLGRRAHTSRNCTTARPPLQTAPPAQHKRPTQFTAGKCDVSKVWGGMRLLDLAGTVK